MLGSCWWIIFYCLVCLGSGSTRFALKSERLLSHWDPVLLAAALGIRAALIVSLGKVGVVPSDSCVCHCVGLGLLISCFCWFGSVHET